MALTVILIKRLIQVGLYLEANNYLPQKYYELQAWFKFLVEFDYFD